MRTLDRKSTALRFGVTRRRSAIAAALAAGTLLAMVATACAAPTGRATAPRAAASAATAMHGVPPKARAIMNKPAYRAARWTYQFADLNTGKVLTANRPGELVFTGSTAKLFTIGTGYAALGPDSKRTTPVYATGRVHDGVLDGNLELVASGDLTMGGRHALSGHDDSSFTATTSDHVYGDLVTNAVKPPGNPLAGLNLLAAEIRAQGIHRVNGDVVIDDRLWQTFAGQEGPVTPIFINDNLLDLILTPTSPGQLAKVATNPVTSAFEVSSTVRTRPGSSVALQVVADPSNPHRLLLTGSIGASAGKRLTIYRIPDAASWARTLFIEALTRAGVAVSAAPLAVNDPARLPPNYRQSDRVAALKSPPLSAFGSMILLTSYNTGANAVLCMLAVHEHSTNCLDGLQPIRALIDRAGLVSNDIVLVDGQGADPASATPQQMVNYLRWTHTQPWGQTLRSGLPVLGESGTLAFVGVHSPAKGQIAAKTGTSAHLDPGTGRGLFNVESFAGFMKTRNGHTVVFDLSMSGGTYPSPIEGAVQSADDVGGVAAAFQQALSR